MTNHESADQSNEGSNPADQSALPYKQYQVVTPRLIKDSSAILEYADREGVNPRWLFDFLEHAVFISNRYIPDRRIASDSDGHYKHFEFAMQIIEGNPPGHLHPEVVESLKKAEEKASKEEKGKPNVEWRSSVGYRWIRENIETLVDIHLDKWFGL